MPRAFLNASVYLLLLCPPNPIGSATTLHPITLFRFYLLYIFVLSVYSLFSPAEYKLHESRSHDCLIYQCLNSFWHIGGTPPYIFVQ